MTNREFSKSDRVFQKACVLARVKATKRQASRYRMGKSGLALRFKAQAVAEVGKNDG